ncbi:hypothetical protein [Streptomyces collinus]|uniref:hypothetical protein n=1 Tax=Streptomyces collinus TaxID=42684 RepID=UPI0036E4377A
MRRSTSFTRLCGSASLVCAALALILVFARYDAPAPRRDILAALGAGAVGAGHRPYGGRRPAPGDAARPRPADRRFGRGALRGGVLLVAVLTVKTLTFARRRVSRSDVRARLRVPPEDAGRGGLHA